MKIEVKGSYRNRMGGKAYVIKDDGSDEPFFVHHSDGYDGWHRRDGAHCNNVIGYDLIAEWTDEPAKPGPTLSSETIDNIAIDSLRWHYNEGEDMEPLQREAFRICLRYYGLVCDARSSQKTRPARRHS